MSKRTSFKHLEVKFNSINLTVFPEVYNVNHDIARGGLFLVVHIIRTCTSRNSIVLQ